jgi:hypothetical protein
MVGWKRGKDEGGDWMRYDQLPLWKKVTNLDLYERRGTLPTGSVRAAYGMYLLRDRGRGWGDSSLLAETCRL